MTSTDVAPIMTGEEIAGLIVALEKDERIADKMPLARSAVFFENAIRDFSYSVDKFPDHIRRAIGDRIQVSGVDEASAIRRAIMASDHGYASIAFYLESVESFVQINSYGEQSKYTPPVQAAQSAIASWVEQLEMVELAGHELEERHHRLIVAAHLLGKLDVSPHNFRVQHDYHVALEMLRTHLPSLLERLDVVISQDYKLVPTMAVAGLAVCIATHPEIDPERIIRTVSERGVFSPDIIESIMQGDAVPLDNGVL